jgi:hypothetical protein
LHRPPETRKTDAVHFSPLPSAPLPLPRRPRRRATGLTLTLLAALALTACSTESGERRRFMTRIAPPQPVLTAGTAYGGGGVTVQAWLGPSVRLRPEGERRRDRPPPRAGERPADLIARPFSEGGSSFSREEIDEMYGRTDFEYMRPPRLALTFTFTNAGAAPITFTIVNVDSGLGNYAARPEQYTLAPGQQGSPDPMLSPIEYNFDQLDVTLTLRFGESRETHVVALRQAPAPAAGARPN